MPPLLKFTREKVLACLIFVLIKDIPKSHSETLGNIISHTKPTFEHKSRIEQYNNNNQSSIQSQIHNFKFNNFESMSNQKQKQDIALESSALRELKEIIKNQASEIEALKKKIAKSPPISVNAHHGHGSEGDPIDPESYLVAPFYELAYKRVSWLGIFLCSLSLTAVIMQGFEHTLSRQIELAYFVPLLAGHGGNTGGQTVGTVLSALSNGSINKKHVFRVIRKEAMSGLTAGLMLGIVVGPLTHYAGGISLHVATVIFCTLPLLSTIAATLAASIPFACIAVGLDPALIAAPAMTSFVDVTGLLAYFLIANEVFKLFGLEL